MTDHSVSRLFPSPMFLTCLLLSVLVLATCGWYLTRLSLPPGPPAVPLLGSLPFLQLSRGLIDWSTDPRVTRHRLTTVTLGPKNFFVINDLKLAKQLFDKEELARRDITEWAKYLFMLNGKIRQDFI